jgi:hypothetical protein
VSAINLDVTTDDRFSALVDSIGYRMAHLAVSIEAAGRELERLRRQRIADREALGLPIPEGVPPGKRLVHVPRSG